MTKEEKRRLRHSLAACQQLSSSPFDTDHAPLAEQEVEGDQTLYSQLTANSTHLSNSIIDKSLNYENLEDQEEYLKKQEEEEEEIMPHFALSWNVQYIGSFPISNVNADHIGQRLEKFQPSSLSQNVELSVSLLGVRVCCEQTMIMSHSLRRVCSVVGRPNSKQVAYIALEPAGRTYRRLCHVFKANDTYQIEEIESVLGQAFEAQTLTKSDAANKNQKIVDTNSSTKVSMNSGTMTEKRSASTVFLNKFLGTKKGSQTIDEASCKRKRRPVSAVFSSAIHRFSNSTTSMTPKRMTTTIELPVTTSQIRKQSSPPGSDFESHRTTSTSSSSTSSSSGSSTSSLTYDEKLGEWIYPIDASTTAQLENCNYFVGLPSRECLSRNLLSKPEGAFVIRYSESKRKCLALSMRVPITHNPSGISHYLIIRNENGYRLKLSTINKPFASLQMLLTHHSVLSGHLPCTLSFVEWDKNAWKQQPTTIDRKQQQRHSTVLSKIDENRNMATPKLRTTCAIEQLSTPRRRDLNAVRRSQFFEIS